MTQRRFAALRLYRIFLVFRLLFLTILAIAAFFLVLMLPYILYSLPEWAVLISAIVLALCALIFLGRAFFYLVFKKDGE